MGCAPPACSSFSCHSSEFFKGFSCISTCVSECGFMDVGAVRLETERTSDTLSWSCALLRAALCGFCEPSSGPRQELLTMSHPSSVLSSLSHPRTNLLEKSLHHNRSCGKLPLSAVCLRMENLVPLCLCWCFLTSGALQRRGCGIDLDTKPGGGNLFSHLPFPPSERIGYCLLRLAPSHRLNEEPAKEVAPC